MKKNIFKYIILIAFMFVATVSCRDEDAVRLPDLQQGVNARVILDENSTILNLLDLPNAQLLFDVYSKNNNIQEIVYTATYVDASFPDQEFAPVDVITVPGSAFANGKATGLKMTAAQLAEAFELPGGLSYLDGGDHFHFTATVALTDGRTFDASNSAPSITEGTNAAFTAKWDLYVACPFKIDEAIGTYKITIGLTDASATGFNGIVEVVKGDNDSQVILKNLFGYPEKWDVVVDVDQATGIATIDSQEAWDSGATYGIGSVNADGFFFSCTGTLNLNAEYTVDAGSFGVYPLQLMKQP